MEQRQKPVDVISVCRASGEIQPLRIRLEDESQCMVKVDIDEVLSVKEIPYVGVESRVFLCRATVWGKPWLFELCYTFRTHRWCIQRRVY